MKNINCAVRACTLCVCVEANATAILSLFIRWAENKSSASIPICIHCSLKRIAKKLIIANIEMPIIWKRISSWTITNKTEKSLEHRRNFNTHSTIVCICLETTLRKMYSCALCVQWSQKGFYITLSSFINSDVIFFDRMIFSSLTKAISRLWPYFRWFLWLVCFFLCSLLLFFFISQNSCIVNISAIHWCEYARRQRSDCCWAPMYFKFMM